MISDNTLERALLNIKRKFLKNFLSFYLINLESNHNAIFSNNTSAECGKGSRNGK